MRVLTTPLWGSGVWQMDCQPNISLSHDQLCQGITKDPSLSAGTMDHSVHNGNISVRSSAGLFNSAVSGRSYQTFPVPTVTSVQITCCFLSGCSGNVQHHTQNVWMCQWCNLGLIRPSRYSIDNPVGIKFSFGWRGTLLPLDEAHGNSTKVGPFCFYMCFTETRCLCTWWRASWGSKYYK